MLNWHGSAEIVLGVREVCVKSPPFSLGEVMMFDCCLYQQRFSGSFKKVLSSVGFIGRELIYWIAWERTIYILSENQWCLLLWGWVKNH